MWLDMLTYMKQELALAAILFLLLIIKIAKGNKGYLVLPVTQLLLLATCMLGILPTPTGQLFDGMFVVDHTTQLEKWILSGGLYLISILFSPWFQKHPHATEFLMLMLASAVGMFFLISSGNWLLFYLSLELATIPVAAMVSFDLTFKRSSEGAMKLILNSAFSSGLLLMGISFLYGTTGTIRFDEMAQLLGNNSVQIIAVVFVFAAFAFKLSVVPFHFWTADVYEGASMPAAAFLSVISKGSVAFIFMTVLYRVFGSQMEQWHMILLVLAVLTMVTGNLFALRQTNIKRFLAFSSIAQVGFLLLAISYNSPASEASVIYFVLIYLFSNLAAFAVATNLCVAAQKEQMSDYRGLVQSNPFLAWTLSIALFSLAGIPPTAGFFGKMFLLGSGAAGGDYWFIGIAALNMVISLFYYLRWVKVMMVDQPEQPLPAMPLNPYVRFGLWVCLTGILLTGVLHWIYDYIVYCVSR